jgi:hypothetical protein
MQRFAIGLVRTVKDDGVTMLLYILHSSGKFRQDFKGNN